MRIITGYSLVSAIGGTLALLVFFDPARIPLDAVPFFWQWRPAIYVVGFLLFWGMAALSAALAVRSVRMK